MPNRTPQTTCHFEHFSLEYDRGFHAALKSTARRLTGNIDEIRAHATSRHLTVVYREIREIQIASGEQNFREHPLQKNLHAVSFRPNLKVTDRNGALLLPKHLPEAALSRVTYWNLSNADFFTLAFLRSKADKQLFIGGCKQADFLFEVAAKNLAADAELSSATYERALEILEKQHAHDEKAIPQFLAYINREIQKGNAAAAENTITDFRRVDRTGEAGISLALLLRDLGRDHVLITAILEEAVARLLKRKPRYYSVRLCAILEFVMAEKLATPAPVQLLWQAYLAAAAEREVALLRKIFLQAKFLKADRETLEMIYKTWRGFARSEPVAEKQKMIAVPKWLAAPDRDHI